MSAKLGIKMIEMYEDMVRKDFAKLTQGAEVIMLKMKAQIKEQVREDFGLLDLVNQERELSMQLAQVQGKLKDLNRETYDMSKRTYKTIVDAEVDRRIEQQFPLLASINETRDEVIRSIKLSGVDDGIAEVFKALPETISKLQRSIEVGATKVEALPL